MADHSSWLRKHANKLLEEQKNTQRKREAIIDQYLLHCPHCGSNDVALTEETPQAMPGSIVSYAFVKCGQCGARGPARNDWNNREYRAQALSAWNKQISKHLRRDKNRSDE